MPAIIIVFISVVLAGLNLQMILWNQFTMEFNFALINLDDDAFKQVLSKYAIAMFKVNV